MSFSSSFNSNNPSLDYSNLDVNNPQTLLDILQQLHQLVLAEGETSFEQWRDRVQRQDFLPSARNLAYYLALRRHDLRLLQAALMPWGLSSLGRIESRVIANLEAAIATLGAVCRVDAATLPDRPAVSKFFEGRDLLDRRTNDLFGVAQHQRQVRIMVTLSTEAATNYSFVRDLLSRGTDCVRINCAHDNQAIWWGMIQNVRRASTEIDRDCKILMDLGGPKPRLGVAIAPSGKQRITRGENLLLTRDLPTTVGSTCFQAQCSLPSILDCLAVGNRVWIDDGKIGAEVEAIADGGVMLRITHADIGGSKLRPDKGLNFPDTDLQLSSLTAKDLEDLDFVAAHADIIGYSFVRRLTDIELLQTELGQRLASDKPLPAIVVKIETPQAVLHLPELIVQAAGRQPLGIMVARGDLAVEIGYQRLAEIQEEILWLSEAAHIPVIWATQVLEHLVKKGIPSRAEVTDAAMAERAECVMLNKGPFIAESVSILGNVLERMEAHQLKKTPPTQGFAFLVSSCTRGNTF
jgi:pyruvate kinase